MASQEASTADAAGELERQASAAILSPQPPQPSSSAPKPRSCALCRSRKVRCDKQSPCSNCRIANIPCVLPPIDQRPRWARRLERLTNSGVGAHSKSTTSSSSHANQDVSKVLGRLRQLESRVKELSGQLEQANVAVTSPNDHASLSPNTLGTSGPLDANAETQQGASPAPSSGSGQEPFGRFMSQDSSSGRYVSSGFWSRVNDELDGLSIDVLGLEDDSLSSDNETSPAASSSARDGRRPSERHAFLFQLDPGTTSDDLQAFQPPPSQIPLLLSFFQRNLNILVQTVHMPTLTKMVASSSSTGFTPANEALMFSIYYATVSSMEEDEVKQNFGSSQADLALKYRLGLERALTKADFFAKPDLVIVQALVNFLCLVRRHENPTFIWMMTGVVIRMAQYLGLQRDGSNFSHLSPFVVETRRKVWWAVCNLDVKASEEQGTELTIALGSFDTKLPLNINDADISPETKNTPPEREGVTDASFVRIYCELCKTMRQMMVHGIPTDAAGLEKQSRLVDEIYQTYQRNYFRFTSAQGNILYWVGVAIARLTMAKMTLIIYLPLLFASSSDAFSGEVRDKLFVSAIEVAEYNHALHAEERCRQWRWLYEIYVHWHAIVYIMIDALRRPWSQVVERGWVALHSRFLIPAPSTPDRDPSIWVPVRKLMAKVRKYRAAEIQRLQMEPGAAMKADTDSQRIPQPSSTGLLPAQPGLDPYRERWYKLVSGQLRLDDRKRSVGSQRAEPLSHATSAEQDFGWSNPYAADMGNSAPNFANMAPEGSTWVGTQIQPNSQPSTSFGSPADVQNTNYADMPWLWADTDPSFDMFSGMGADSMDVNMDSDSEFNWNDWLESTKALDWDTGLKWA